MDGNKKFFKRSRLITNALDNKATILFITNSTDEPIYTERLRKLKNSHKQKNESEIIAEVDLNTNKNTENILHVNKNKLLISFNGTQDNTKAKEILNSLIGFFHNKNFETKKYNIQRLGKYYIISYKNILTNTELSDDILILKKYSKNTKLYDSTNNDTNNDSSTDNNGNIYKQKQSILKRLEKQINNTKNTINSLISSYIKTQHDIIAKAENEFIKNNPAFTNSMTQYELVGLYSFGGSHQNKDSWEALQAKATLIEQAKYICISLTDNYFTQHSIDIDNACVFATMHGVRSFFTVKNNRRNSKDISTFTDNAFFKLRFYIHEYLQYNNIKGNVILCGKEDYTFAVGNTKVYNIAYTINKDKIYKRTFLTNAPIDYLLYLGIKNKNIPFYVTEEQYEMFDIVATARDYDLTNFYFTSFGNVSTVEDKIIGEMTNKKFNNDTILKNLTNNDAKVKLFAYYKHRIRIYRLWQRLLARQ